MSSCRIGCDVHVTVHVHVTWLDISTYCFKAESLVLAYAQIVRCIEIRQLKVIRFVSRNIQVKWDIKTSFDSHTKDVFGKFSTLVVIQAIKMRNVFFIQLLCAFAVCTASAKVTVKSTAEGYGSAPSKLGMPIRPLRPLSLGT